MNNSDMQYIRDPIHGFIGVYPHELELIDTREMQRLRRVSQLGTVPLVYPSATHTRFSHSIGVMHIADKFAKGIGMSDEEVKAVRLAGLLHDIGHGPFSHASEEVSAKEGISHEEISCKLVDNMGDKLPVSSERIKPYILGNADYNIINKSIDADKMDYLLRDSRFSGIDFGAIDADTLVRFADSYNGDIVFQRKGVEALKELLMARLHMAVSTYNHHASRLGHTILIRALDKYAEEVNTYNMMRNDDYEMHYKLMNHGGDVTTIYEKYAFRELPKRCFTIRGDEVEKNMMRDIADLDGSMIEEEIAERVGVDSKEVFINQPKIPSPGVMDISILDDGTVKHLNEVSNIPSQIKEDYWNSLRVDIYGPENQKEAIRESAIETLDSKLGI